MPLDRLVDDIIDQRGGPGEEKPLVPERLVRCSSRINALRALSKPRLESVHSQGRTPELSRNRGYFVVSTGLADRDVGQAATRDSAITMRPAHMARSARKSRSRWPTPQGSMTILRPTTRDFLKPGGPDRGHVHSSFFLNLSMDHFHGGEISTAYPVDRSQIGRFATAGNNSWNRYAVPLIGASTSVNQLTAPPR